jgi:RNA methyltransferase, TrmH family
MDRKGMEANAVTFCFSLPFFLYSIVNLSQSEIKYLRSLQQKKYRDAERKFLLEGWRPLLDALHSSFQIELIAVLGEDGQKSEHQPIFELAQKRGIAVKEIKELQLKQISDSVHSQGVVALVHQHVKPLDVTLLQSAQCIVACDRLSDPGNLGTILRTCDWFGVDAVLLNPGCVSLYNEKVVRSTAGSIFHLKVFEDVDFGSVFSTLKSENFKVVATALNGKSLTTSTLPEKVVFLLGNEAQGVHPQLIQQADTVVSIPRYGQAESLNVGIACGVFLEHWRNRSLR